MHDMVDITPNLFNLIVPIPGTAGVRDRVGMFDVSESDQHNIGGTVTTQTREPNPRVVEFLRSNRISCISASAKDSARNIVSSRDPRWRPRKPRNVVEHGTIASRTGDDIYPRETTDNLQSDEGRNSRTK